MYTWLGAVADLLIAEGIQIQIGWSLVNSSQFVGRKG